MRSCLRRSVPEIHFHVDGTLTLVHLVSFAEKKRDSEKERERGGGGGGERRERGRERERKR